MFAAALYSELWGYVSFTFSTIRLIPQDESGSDSNC